MITKAALRKEYKEKRASVKNKDALSEKICNTFLNTDIYKNCRNLLCYQAIGSEVDCEAIITKALSDGKKVALPVCINKNGYMRFYYIGSLDELRKGMFSIPEPEKRCVADDFSKDDVCIVPGVCFDKTGARLGYGKGYYDRFLSKHSIISVGVCYDECVCDTIPTDTTDEKVQFLITEERIHIF